MIKLKKGKKTPGRIAEQPEEQQNFTEYLVNDSILVKDPLKGPRRTHRDIFDDPVYRSAFPLFERFLNSAVNVLRNPNPTFVDALEQAQSLKGASAASAKFRQDLKDKLLKIRVLSTSRLELDPYVSHPFVRIHLVNKKTGCYIQKLGDQPAIYNTERLVRPIREAENKNKFKSFENEIVPSFSTECCDFRLQGNSNCNWVNQFLVNQPAQDIVDGNLLILFELLDFNHKLLINRDHSLLNSEKLYPIAWAYLRPLGVSKVHIGISKLQLHKYKCNSKSLPSGFPGKFIPKVYLQFLWPSKTNYQGFLTVNLQSVEIPQRQQKFFQDPKNVFEVEKGDQRELFSFLDGLKEPKDGIVSHQKEKNLAITRLRGESCLVPNRLKAKLVSGLLGCYRLKFSPDGQHLAISCNYKQSTSLKFYRVSDMKLIYIFKGHSGLIHCIRWSGDSKLVLTASNDRTAKLWLFPQYTQELISQEQSQSLLVSTLYHPGFVYSVQLINKNDRFAQVASACSDGRLRIWRCQLREVSLVQSIPYKQFNFARGLSVYPNTLENRDGTLYVGDSQGRIFMMQLGGQDNQIVASSPLTNKEVRGDCINKISITNENRILVHSRNNVVRICTASADHLEINYRFYGSTSEKHNVQSVLSPDEKYILAGSEDGKPHLWDTKLGIKVEHSLDLAIDGLLTSADWNHAYHMVAIGGFGAQFPAYVYVYEKSEQELKQNLGKLGVRPGMQ